MAITKDEIIEAVGNMSVMDLNDLVKAFEEKFGVSAAAMAVADTPNFSSNAFTRSFKSITDILPTASIISSLVIAIFSS